MAARKCDLCGAVAHVAIADGPVVCWGCYNLAVKESATKVEARTLRKSYRIMGMEK